MTRREFKPTVHPVTALEHLTKYHENIVFLATSAQNAQSMLEDRNIVLDMKARQLLAEQLRSASAKVSAFWVQE